MNDVTFTKIKVQSINNSDLISRASNKLRGDVIRFGTFYVCDVTHYEILETIFPMEELNYDELVFEAEVGRSDDEIECNETYFFI